MKPFLISNRFDLSRLKTSDGKYVFTSDNLAVYVQSANPSVPTNTGIGVLSEAVSCKVTHGPKGYDELEMEYPVEGHLYSDLALRALIVANVERTRGNQAYRIYRITKPINGRIKVYARHIAYDLSGIVVKPFTTSNLTQTLSALKSNAMTNCPFTFTASRTSNIPFEVKKPSSIWSLMGSGEGNLQDVYNGEFLFNNYSIAFEDHLGSDNNVQVTYGVNMTDFEQDSACDECYTGVVGYWEENDEVVYSPVVTTIGQYDYVKILTVDMTSYWDERPSVAEIENAVKTYISANDIGIPKVSWTINYVPLDMTEEYKNTALIQQVSLGDTVHVRFEKLGINTTARAIEIEWDVLLDRYSSVSLGDVKKNVASTLASHSTLINNATTSKDVESISRTISDMITKSILGANGGSVRFLDTNGDGEPDTLYIADNPDPVQAVKVWRFNYEGWGASSNGYNGPFKMGATLNDGLLADFVTAAKLVAGTIQSADGKTFVLDLDNGTLDMSGTLTIGGNNNVNGKLIINNANGEPIAESDWMGINFYSGLSHADKSIYYRVSRAGFIVHAGDSENNAGSVVALGGEYDSTSKMGYGSLSFNKYNTQTGTLHVNTILLDGLSGAIKSNHHNIVWTDKGESIASSTNILLLDPGRYYCTNASTAQTLVNCPTNTNFALFISDRNLDSDRKNYFIHDGNNNIYVNAQTGTSAYSGWRRLNYTSV